MFFFVFDFCIRIFNYNESFYSFWDQSFMIISIYFDKSILINLYIYKSGIYQIPKELYEFGLYSTEFKCENISIRFPIYRIPRKLFQFGLYYTEFRCSTFQSGFHFPELENNFSIRLVFHRISCSEFRSHFCCSVNSPYVKRDLTNHF